MKTLTNKHRASRCIMLNVSSRPAEQELEKEQEPRGKAVADSGFKDLIARLVTAYDSWELPRILVENKLGRAEVPVSLDDLADLAQRAFFDAHPGKQFDPHDSRFSHDTFREVALHAVAALQHKAVELFQLDLNDAGYMLLVSDDDVRWHPWREGIREFIREQKQAATV